MVYSRHPANTDFYCLPGLKAVCYQETLQQSLQLINVFRHLCGRRQQQKLLCNFHCLPQIARCRDYVILVAVITVIITTVINSY